MKDKTENKGDRKVIGLAEARRLIREADVTLDEFAVLARMEARVRGLKRARKCARSSVSQFLSANLTKGHPFEAIVFASEKYLGVEIDINLDAA